MTGTYHLLSDVAGVTNIYQTFNTNDPALTDTTVRLPMRSFAYEAETETAIGLIPPYSTDDETDVAYNATGQ